MTQKTYDQVFNDRMKEKLVSMPFDFEMTAEYRELALRTFRDLSPFDMNTMSEDYGRLFKKFDNCSEKVALNYYDFSIINNALQKISPRNAQFSVAQYCEVMEQAEDLAKRWNADVEPLTAQVNEALQTEIRDQVLAAQEKQRQEAAEQLKKKNRGQLKSLRGQA